MCSIKIKINLRADNFLFIIELADQLKFVRLTLTVKKAPVKFTGSP